jgi:retron-type reverse transcriptase
LSHLRTVDDVAFFLRVPRSALIYTLYKAPDAQRYRRFEIPKRGGGTRLISAPRGLIRTAQDAFLQHLIAIHGPIQPRRASLPGAASAAMPKPMLASIWC